MENFGLLSILPPVISIVLALVTKDVITSLFLGCFSAFTILAGGNVLHGISDTLMSFIKVFESNGNTICIGITVLLGGLLYVTEKSGGVQGFAKFFTSKRSFIKTRRGAEIFSWFIGIIVFTSGTVSALITGTVARPLTDAFKVPHEKLAYIVHSTTSPVCALLPLSAWGAYMIGLIQAQGIDNPAAVMVKSIPLNFYSIIALFLVLFFAISGKDYGPMVKAEQRVKETGLLDAPKGTMDQEEQAQEAAAASEIQPTTMWNLVLPIIAMTVMIIAGLLITGKGNILEGAGMTAILWGNTFAIFVALIMYTSQKIMTYKEFINIMFEGAGKLLPIAFILIFAWSLGGAVKQLGTGVFLAETLSGIITPAFLPPLIFIISCIISFATGSSWGTMAVMCPIALPMAIASGANIALCFGAIVGGALFGDHSSPISDSTIMSCFTTRCDIMDHVRTQLPYTLTAAAGAMGIYLILGFVF